MEKTLDVSVVVRTYTDKRWDYLVEALESVQRQRTPARELVVVGDHNPELYQRVQQRFPDALVVENDQPRGSSGAWNAGIMAAGSSVVAFLDDDAEAAPDWLEQLLAPYADARVLGVGGAIRAHWLGGARPRWFPEEFDWVVGCSYRGLPEQVAPVRNLIGCNMSFRRSVFEEIGGFRKGMGHVGGRPIGDDETELSIRVGNRWPEGLILHQPGAAVDHKVPASRARWGYFYDRCRLEGRSKALMSRLVGTRRGLASERAYVWHTLPAGVGRGLAAPLRGDWGGPLRAWAIVSGLAVTGASYLWGALQERLAPPQGDTSVTPIPPAGPH
jgi:GT2 family glycosyltransferase